MIAYKVGKRELLTHAGVPVFGLYPDHVNKVDVTARLLDHGEMKTVKHIYSIWCGPVRGIETGAPVERNFLFETEVKRMAADFKGRLYLINNFGPATGLNNRMVWNNPEGSALT